MEDGSHHLLVCCDSFVVHTTFTVLINSNDICRPDSCRINVALYFLGVV